MPQLDSAHKYRSVSVQGRYVTYPQIADFLSDYSGELKIAKEGSSVQGKPIPFLTIGKGNKRILMWSQMHGNESTTTKAVLDILNYLKEAPWGQEILAHCTLGIIPMLNPDGAENYTRVNANDIDLNRDAQALSQPESRFLRDVYDEFGPHYCFNLHDQRTIFNVGEQGLPATLSFLAPAFDESRSINASRKKSMQLIALINAEMQALIPGQIGRYDDSFNLNCVGDTFQSMGCPTLLFEAGHYPGDYSREKTRYLVYKAILTALRIITKGEVEKVSIDRYSAIPENNKMFFDILIKNAHLLQTTWKVPTHAGILYKEILEDGVVQFKPQLEQKGALQGYFGHKTYDCKQGGSLQLLKDEEELIYLLN